MAANQRDIEELQKSWKQKYDESQRGIKVMRVYTEVNHRIFTYMLLIVSMHIHAMIIFLAGERGAGEEKKACPDDHSPPVEPS